MASEGVGFGGGWFRRRSGTEEVGSEEVGQIAKWRRSAGVGRGGPRGLGKEVGKIGKKKVGKIGKRRLGKWKKGGWENGKKEVGKIAKRRLGKKTLESIKLIR